MIQNSWPPSHAVARSAVADNFGCMTYDLQFIIFDEWLITYATWLMMHD